MSIYAALKFPAPVMAYCALHQVKEGKDSEDYKQTMKDFHRLLVEETEKLNAIWDTYRIDAQERAVKVSRGLLSTFLSTPLKSDDDEILKILRDQIAEYTKQLVPQHRYGMVRTEEGRILRDHEAVGLTRKLLTSGRAYLKDLEFQTGKNSTDIFESMFIIEGGMNFDVIEHLVRDRIGIYTPVHGKHITEFDAYAYAAYNRILSSGSGQAGSGFEATLFFSKGSTRYEPFRNSLSELLRIIGSTAGVLSVSVWQRKLGLGVGREFAMRISLNALEHVQTVVDQIATQKGEPFRSALLAGSMLIKESVI